MLRPEKEVAGAGVQHPSTQLQECENRFLALQEEAECWSSEVRMPGSGAIGGTVIEVRALERIDDAGG